MVHRGDGDERLSFPPLALSTSLSLLQKADRPELPPRPIFRGRMFNIVRDGLIVEAADRVGGVGDSVPCGNRPATGLSGGIPRRWGRPCAYRLSISSLSARLSSLGLSGSL
jgi:hypothetical protein